MENNTTDNTAQQEKKSDESSSSNNNNENEGVVGQSSTTTKTEDETQTQPTTTVQENTESVITVVDKQPEVVVNANEESNPIETRKDENSSVSVSNAVEVQSETTLNENIHTQPQPIQTNEEVKNEEQQPNTVVEGQESDNDNAVNTTNNNVQINNTNNNGNDNENENNVNNNSSNENSNNSNVNRERTTSQTSNNGNTDNHLKVSQNSTDNNNNTNRERTASQSLKQSNNNVLGIANYGSDSESGSESESESEVETPKEQSSTQFLGNMEIFKDLATPSPSTPSQHTDTVNPTITALVENFSKEMNSVIDKINGEGNHNNDNNTNHITNNNSSPNNTTLQSTQQKSPNSRPPFKPASLITSIPSLHPNFVTTPSPQSRAISLEAWQKSLSRFKQYEDEKKEKVKVRLEELKKGEKMANTFKPTISKKSLELAGGNREDLFKRIEEGLKASKSRLESARKSKEESMLKELQKLPTILPVSKKLHRNLDDMATWNKAKFTRIQNVHEKDKEKETEDLKTMFKPQINPKSAEIFKSKGEKKSVVKRLTEAPKCTDVPSNNTPFQPEINPRSRSIKLESPVFDRLYKSGMQNIISKHRYMVDNWDFSYHNIRKPIHLEAEPGFNFAVNVSSIEQDARTAEYEYEGFNSPSFDHREQQSVPTDYYQIQQQYQESEPEFDENEISSQEMNRYLETFSDANGYDEELRQLMMQAGFFKTDYIQDSTQMDDINPDEYAPYIIDENGNYIQNIQNSPMQMNIPSQQMYSYSSDIPPRIPQYYQPYSQQSEIDTNPYYDENFHVSTSPQFQYQYYPTVPQLHPVDENTFVGQGSLSPLSLSPQSESKRLLRSTPQSQDNQTLNNSDSMVKGLSTSSPGKVESQITSPNIGRINNNNIKRASTPNPIGSKKETPTSNLKRSRPTSGGKVRAQP